MTGVLIGKGETDLVERTPYEDANDRGDNGPVMGRQRSEWCVMECAGGLVPSRK